MAAVLFLIGKKLEPPSTVSLMLDIAACPCKPVYEFASELPLVLFDCGYPGMSVNCSQGSLVLNENSFSYDIIDTLEQLKQTFYHEWETTSMQADMTRVMLNTLDAVSPNFKESSKSRSSGSHYKPLAKRPRTMSLEERKELLSPAKRRKMEAKAAGMENRNHGNSCTTFSTEPNETQPQPGSC